MTSFECRKQIDKNITTYLVTGELDLDLPETFAGYLEKPIKHDVIKKIIDEHERKKAS